MAEQVFAFKAASIGGEDNRIIIDFQGNPDPSVGFAGHNEPEARALAEQLASWLTPASTRVLASKFREMGY